MHDFLPLNRISDRIILNFRKILYSKFFFLVVCLVQACMHAKLLQLCLTLCDPMDCSPPGSSCLWNCPGKILEWISVPFSRGSSQPRVESGFPALQADFLPSEQLGKPMLNSYHFLFFSLSILLFIGIPSLFTCFYYLLFNLTFFVFFLILFFSLLFFFPLSLSLMHINTFTAFDDEPL